MRGNPNGASEYVSGLEIQRRTAQAGVSAASDLDLAGVGRSRLKQNEILARRAGAKAELDKVEERLRLALEAKAGKIDELYAPEEKIAAKPTSAPPSWGPLRSRTGVTTTPPSAQPTGAVGAVGGGRLSHPPKSLTPIDLEATAKAVLDAGAVKAAPAGKVKGYTQSSAGEYRGIPIYAMKAKGEPVQFATVIQEAGKAKPTVIDSPNRNIVADRIDWAIKDAAARNPKLFVATEMAPVEPKGEAKTAMQMVGRGVKPIPISPEEAKRITGREPSGSSLYMGIPIVEFGGIPHVAKGKSVFQTEYKGTPFLTRIQVGGKPPELIRATTEAGMKAKLDEKLGETARPDLDVKAKPTATPPAERKVVEKKKE
jgi:hypothetical protein